MYTCTSYIPSTGSRLRNDGPKVHSTEDVCSTDEDLNILPQAQSTSTHERFTVDLNHHFEDSRKSAPPASSQSQTYRAIYDYEAREDDEVTFIEGDIILNGDPITEGWMFGTVQRTGQFGMLPSNYVELLK
ncbi:LIM and SH3 domain protein 1 [Fasciola hepatica]|uniref:LIM and SH3 domain protein 1 n=1 Tax=Fasciola hepatica TaxID=6192 RepID=A0A4E0RY83_FASHE|nr:LIM and SH3 domain protein 1 [Fasciola hepatica]